MCVKFPRAACAKVLRSLKWLPGFTTTTLYKRDRLEAKTRMKNADQPVGHALGDRFVTVEWHKHKICSYLLSEGADATADQFFLNRPIADLDFVLKLAEPHLKLERGDIVFDPGCGAGRHLLYLSDKLGVRGIGVDIYEPAIRVATIANLFKRCDFHCGSSLEAGLLDSLLPNGCKVIFINSWLNHVRDFKGFDNFLKESIAKCEYFIIINTEKDPLERYFSKGDILECRVLHRTQFAVVKGKRNLP